MKWFLCSSWKKLHFRSYSMCTQSERGRERENNFHAKCLCAFCYCCHTAPSIVVVAVAIAAGFMLFFFLPKLFTFVIYFEQILSYSNR